jgi:hypothetical protein
MLTNFTTLLFDLNSYSYSLRGAVETSTCNIGANLVDLSKRIISRKLSVPKDSISIDCDAISVVISTRTLTEVKRKVIKDFFRVFGSDLSGCSLPDRAIGSSKRSGLFVQRQYVSAPT